MSTTISKEWLEKTISEGHLNYYKYDKFTNGKNIGHGGYGEVSKYEWKDNELIVALKCLKKIETNTSREIIDNFISELKLLRKVSAHPNIISFYGVTQDDKGCYYMILQYANYGNLREYLKSNFRKLKLVDKLRIASEIVSGLMFLHNEGIIHRDLHSKNILIHNDQPQITDFGLSKLINETSKSSHSVVGMMPYIEPQCLNGEHYTRDKRSDIYNLGVILWEISSGKKPPLQMMIMIMNREIEKPEDDTPPQYIELYKKCWDYEPINRPDTKSILNQLAHLISNNTSIKNNENLYLQIKTGEGPSKQKHSRLDSKSVLNQINQPILNEHLSRNDELIIENDEVPSKQNTNAQINFHEPIISPAINVPMNLSKAPNSSGSISFDSNQQKESTNSSVIKSSIKNLSFFVPVQNHNESSINETTSSSLSTSDLNHPYQINNQGKITLTKEIEDSLRDKTQTSLNLKQSQLGPDETKELSKALTKFSNLISLNLSWNRLGPEGGKVLSQVLFMLTKLESLNLTNNRLGSEGGKAIAEALSKHNTLTYLNLCSNNLGPEGGIALAEALCKNTNLKILNLTNTKLRSEGGKAIANAIINNKTLITLTVSTNNLGPEGGKAFAEAIKRNKTLESLSLDKNQLGSEAGIALANAITVNITLSSLNLNENNFGDAARKLLNKSRNVKYLKNFELKK